MRHAPIGMSRGPQSAKDSKHLNSATNKRRVVGCTSGRCKRRKKHPKVFVKSTITYEVTGKNIDEKALRRAIQLSADRYCPAQGMLDKVMPIGLFYEIYETGDDGERTLVVKGEYKRE